jgi:branched-subunit amino acid aminotransferase/4-amino-4-deoxychorismate lyase
MPRMKGVWRREWANCDRCGFPHPIEMLSMQLGLKLCKDHGCWDDLSNYYRPTVIAGVLSSDNEGRSNKPEVFQDPQELTL